MTALKRALMNSDMPTEIVKVLVELADRVDELESTVEALESEISALKVRLLD